MKKTMKYNGITMDTIYWEEIDEKQLNELREQYFKKPDYKLVQKQFIDIANYGLQTNIITNYYVKDLMAKVKLYFSKWCIEDVFNSTELMGFFVNKIKTNEKVYPKDLPIIQNIETAFRLGGKGIATKPSNFPIYILDEILEKYNINNNYYDFSCGWGTRLLGTLRNNVNYFGTDPNYLLTERLTKMAKNYKETTYNHSKFDIRTQGSEEFIPEWENKIGLAFSSPPYFKLEDYKIGKQSYKDGISYENWLNNYLRPTIHNIYKYLTKDGLFIININNFDKYDLIGDTIKIAELEKFEFLGNHVLKNVQRINEKGILNDNSEKILVFAKPNSKSKMIYNEQMTILDFIEGE